MFEFAGSTKVGFAQFRHAAPQRAGRSASPPRRPSQWLLDQLHEPRMLPDRIEIRVDPEFARSCPEKLRQNYGGSPIVSALLRAWRLLPWLVTYAVAMAYVESAVVVYLRAIYYPRGFSFPLAPMPQDMVAIEIGREVATLVMLLGVAMLAGTERWDRFLTFCVSFGVWDLFYYVWLWLLLGWPPSLLTWDVLFLIPVPWIGPVLAPAVVSIALVIGGLLLLHKGARGEPVNLSVPLWILLVTGGRLVLSSFVLDFRVALLQLEPPSFRWGLFGTGVALGVVALVLALQKRS